MSSKVSFNSTILEAASQHLGTEEWPGSKHNPAVLAYFEASGNGWVKDDETPWCAAFVNAILASLGLPTTGKLNARSFDNYGASVALADVRPGDIVTLWRGDPNGWQGHVGFVMSMKGNEVSILGGNQGNAVSIANYPISRVVAFRRVVGIPDHNDQNRPTLREGDQGPFVTDLQVQLANRQYGVGRIDGVFGGNTRRALVQFQSDNDLKADGIAGPKTWKAFESVASKPPRLISEQGLRNEGSRTIEAADQGQREIKTASAGVGGLAGFDMVLDAAKKAASSQDTLSTLQAIVSDNWPVVLIAVVAGIAWFRGPNIMAAIRGFRTEDAQTGANMSR